MEIAGIRRRIERHYLDGAQFVPTKDALHDAIIALAQDNRYNPVVDRIRAAEWDGVDRLTDFGARYLGQDPDDILANLQAALLPRGMVVRALHPGAIFPYIPVLVSSKQGAGKFEILNSLAPGKYIEGLQMDGVDAQKRLQERGAGASVIEMGEIDAIGGRNMSAAKSFATLVETDNREAYARDSTNRKMTFIIVGTTNNLHFLTDTEHRRNPVIVIRDDWKVPTDLIVAERAQIYAQCAAEFDAGQWWEAKNSNHAVRLPQEFWAEANERSATHELPSPLRDWLADFLKVDWQGHGPHATQHIPSSKLTEALHAQDTGFRGQIANQELSRAMQALGYSSGRYWIHDSDTGERRRVRQWIRAELMDEFGI